MSIQCRFEDRTDENIIVKSFHKPGEAYHHLELEKLAIATRCVNIYSKLGQIAELCHAKIIFQKLKFSWSSSPVAKFPAHLHLLSVTMEAVGLIGNLSIPALWQNCSGVAQVTTRKLQVLVSTDTCSRRHLSEYNGIQTSGQ
nr:AlNc14C164G7844 [Albugo laibachii Nc14]|eukprot:CCA22698.1 AlNc14C164G7844 [Albugo laibachii Nc14]